MNVSKISLLTLITLILSTHLFAQARVWENVISSNNSLCPSSIASTDEGNVYTTGYFNGTASLGDKSLSSKGDTDAFIAKYDSMGNLIWVRQIGGSSFDYGTSISVDKMGNCYVSGTFGGTCYFGNTQLTASGYDNDFFVVKYDKDGNFLWVNHASGSISYKPQISTDNNGGCYLSGNCDNVDTKSFGTTQIYGPFIAKYDASGNFSWVKAGRKGSVTSDLTGSLYVAGGFSDTLRVDNKKLIGTSPWYSDIFVARFDIDGNNIWIKKAGGTDADIANSISVDPNGNCYVTGSFNKTAFFDTTQINSYGSTDIFTAKYDKDGNLAWVKKAGSNGDDAGYSISTDQNGNSYVTGSYSNTSTFGNVQVTSAGSTDVFVTKLDKNGNFLWIKHNGDLANDKGLSVTADGRGNCYSLYSADMPYMSYFAYLAKFSAAKLTLLTPSVGDKWRIGTKQTVSWTTNVEKVMVQLSTNGGVGWIDLTPTPIDGHTGTYNLTVPNRPSANCKVRIYDPEYPDLAADTSGIFTVTNSSIPSIVITSPNGNEKWKIGTEHYITWTASSTGASLSIEYTNDGGNSWKVLSDNVAASLGSFKWTAPGDTSGQCRIRIKDTANPSVYDISDNFFKVLPSPRIIFPDKPGDTLKIAALQNLKWTAPLINRMNIYYSTDKGKNWNQVNFYYDYLTDTVDASKGLYSWKVPAVSNSDSCRLKIVDIDDPSFNDESDGFFTIYNPIRITFPKAGDTLQAGNIYDVTWNSEGIKNIKMEYSVRGPASCYLQYADHYCDTMVVKEDVRSLPYEASLGIYTWIVPDNASPRIRFKIYDALNPQVYNETGMFVITPMPSPDSLLALFTSNAVKLSWKDKTDYEEGFKIERKEGSGSYAQIATVDMNVTNYTDNTIDPKNVNTYSYRIRAYNTYASSPYTEISLNPTSVNDKEAIPQTYALEQNHPNPFNPSTVISFSLPRESQVKLIVFNELGERVTELLNSTKAAGRHEVNFNAAGLASGLYFYSLEAKSIDGKDSFRQIKKMLLVK